MKQEPEQRAAALASADSKLYDVAAKQICFKPGPVLNTMLDVVTQLRDDRIKWGDEFDLATHGTAHANCVGTAFKLLMRAGLVVRMEQHRRSSRAGQNGRVVWKYRLASDALAATFLGRNHRSTATKGQSELALEIADSGKTLGNIGSNGAEK